MLASQEHIHPTLFSSLLKAMRPLMEKENDRLKAPLNGADDDDDDVVLPLNEEKKESNGEEGERERSKKKQERNRGGKGTKQNSRSMSTTVSSTQPSHSLNSNTSVPANSNTANNKNKRNNGTSRRAASIAVSDLVRDRVRDVAGAESTRVDPVLTFLGRTSSIDTPVVSLPQPSLTDSIVELMKR